ncbi:MAG: 16S rRNA (cytidine(1402)-2'-O)-methyltransferase [Verrucomicrobia bacterium]|nr:16S rRNA (cytidine(1402)-2'-O)-methyltransferase [Verrucomicrobiota bacterium]MDA1067002.1 16S rRNA (cytidine(1402)-2'-O)-methyltransferase [Verrucomicrobiota bacterium]
MTQSEGNELPLASGLYLVATPIGNLGDISKRALEILKRCDLIACEDTRTSGKLLKHFEIKKPLISYHEHNEIHQASVLADKIDAGSSIALISDAGTPAVSDPGFRLVRECRKRNLNVSPIPGPSAALAALSVSGLPSDSFTYVGFLPAKSAARKRFFNEIKDTSRTHIVFESNHRILKFLNDFLEILGPDHVLCVARELTKLHETIFTGPAVEVIESVKQRSTKGEFVVVIAPRSFDL